MRSHPTHCSALRLPLLTPYHTPFSSSLSSYGRRGARGCRVRYRYDYEGVASEGASEMMGYLRSGPAQPADDMGHGFKLEGKCPSILI